MKNLRVVLWLGVVIALGGYAYLTVFTQQSDAPAGAKNSPKMALKTTGRGPMLDFALTTHKGDTLTGADLKGRYRLMYFGYTFCPDKCPLDLAKMTLALSALEEDGVALDGIQPLFVTIDPERDTVDMMAETLSLYHPAITGLTGSMEDIAAMAKTFNIYYRKIEEEGVDGYLMDHFVAILLYDTEGRFMTVFGQTDTADFIAAQLKALIKAKS